MQMKSVLNITVPITTLLICICLTACLGPKSASDYGRLAAMCGDQKQYQKAIDYSSKAISLDPKNGGSYFVRGTAYFEVQQYEKAVDDFSKTIELTAYTPTGDPAKDKLFKSLAGDKVNEFLAEAYHRRGQAYEKLGKHDLAHNDLAQAQKMGYKPEQE
jgi:tetratricopeptide (TPR) repeat protein